MSFKKNQFYSISGQLTIIVIIGCKMSHNTEIVHNNVWKSMCLNKRQKTSKSGASEGLAQ